MKAQGGVLVIFGAKAPRGGTRWWGQFDTLIGPAALAPVAKAHGLTFEELAGFVDPGSLEEATALLHELATLTYPDGRRLSESIAYKGYELWWILYEELHLRQCLPYTQYKRLLERLAHAPCVVVDTPPSAELFRAYFAAHGVTYDVRISHHTTPALGIWLQVALTLLSWPILMITRPRLMLYTGDLFDPPHDYSFRMRLVYEELRRRHIPFVEFIRSMEGTATMLAHAFKRRRPVVYSYAIKVVLAWFASFGGQGDTELPADPEQAFRFALASIPLRQERGLRWSVRAMAFFTRSVGVRTAIIPAASSRTFAEVIGCRLARVPTAGILHGAVSRVNNVYDFIPEYRSSTRIALDRYGVWSPWWRDYYLAHGKMYGADELVVSGPMRPLVGAPGERPPRPDGPLRVLLISEQVAVPEEVVPYLERLRAEGALELSLKVRPYHDGFHQWLVAHRPDLLEGMRVVGGSMQEAIAEADVVVGSYSTGVLEALLQGCPPVFFYTRKWGDYYGLGSVNAEYHIFARDEEELVRFAFESKSAPPELLEKLKEMFFGDPYANGSAWVVSEALALTRDSKANERAT